MIPLSPIPKAEEDRLKTFTERSEFVLDMRRNFCEDRTLDEAVLFQFAQLQGQHPLRAVGKKTSKFSEPVRSLREPIEDDALPAATNYGQGRFNSAAALFLTPLLH